MKKYILLSSFLVASTLTFAQGESDALSFSLTDINGTARYVSMSGAFGALGGDMTVLGMNPAGIAVFRSSEMSITPSLSSTSATSIFNKNESSDSRLNALVNNFGYVGSFRTYEESEISNFNFGISYNKTKDFNRKVYIKGFNRTTSLLNTISDNQLVTNPIDDGLTDLGYMAYKSVLIDPVNEADPQDDHYEPLIRAGEKFDNTMELIETGSVNEWNFSLGANYNHSLYFGMSLGLQNIDYELLSTYKEVSTSDETFGFNLANVLVTQGTGVNLKLGVIVRLIPQLRLGFAYHTPSYFYMTDVFSSNMSSRGVTDGSGQTEFYVPLDEASMDYQYQTPGRLMYSLAYQFGQKGFLSLDWDVIDYREITLKDANGFQYENVNGYLNDDFRAASNLRLGAEYRLTENVSLRGGAAWYQSPIKSSVKENNTEFFTVGANTDIIGTKPQYSMENDTYYLSCGIGYRTGGFFLDAALQRQMRNEYFYNFYDRMENADPKYADLNTNKTNLVVSLGFKF